MGSLDNEIKKKVNKNKITKIFKLVLTIMTAVAFLGCIGYSITAIILDFEPNSRMLNSNYGLMLVECVASLIVVFLPLIIEKWKKVHIPEGLYILYVLFLFSAAFLGEFCYFYYIIPFWDTIMHALSGIMLGVIGCYVFKWFSKDADKDSFRSLFMVIFAFCFAITLGALWEIYEFVFDIILKLNMQRYAVPKTGEELIGQAVLVDTMKDIIWDVIGALVGAFGWYFLALGKSKTKKLETDVKEEKAKEPNVRESEVEEVVKVIKIKKTKGKKIETK